MDKKGAAYFYTSKPANCAQCKKPLPVPRGWRCRYHLKCRQRKFYLLNRQRRGKDRINADSRAAWKRLRAEIIHAYEGRCVCCDEARPEFLGIDHINGDGAAHRRALGRKPLYRWLRQNGFPKDGFRLLCHNCNFARGHYGYCPHEVRVDG